MKEINKDQIYEALNFLYSSKKCEDRDPVRGGTLEWAKKFLDNHLKEFNEFLTTNNVSAVPEALMEYPFLFEGKPLSREKVTGLFEEWKLNRE